MRAETGTMQFGDDWPGVFIRGDDAAGYALVLQLALKNDRLHPLTRLQLEGLLRLLQGCHVGEHPVPQCAMLRDVTDGAHE